MVFREPGIAMTQYRRLLPATCLALLAVASAGAGAQDKAADLRQRYEQQRRSLDTSAFGRPLIINSNDSSGQPRGEVLAVLDHDYDTLVKTLRQPQAWCELMLLQTNVKRCDANGTEGGGKLDAFITRKHEQTVEDAYEVAFQHRVREADAQHFEVDISAAAGPLGTRDYRLTLEAVPLSKNKSVARLTYSYTAGTLARLASETYLSTAGRSKVGFTVVGRDGAGKPVHVGGIRGLAERSAMRYQLALEAVLDAVKAPPAQRAEARLQDWFDGIERYAVQLKEMSREDYLAMKRREFRAMRSGPMRG